MQKSETGDCRERLLRFCEGNGLDVGFGGDPISPTAICIDRAETAPGRHKMDIPSPTHLVGDAANLLWFRDGVLDYVYSSHTLEDFVDTKAVLAEWLRVIRKGGHLVLFLPDEQAYRYFHRADLSVCNQSHKHMNFGLPYLTGCLGELGYAQSEIIHSLFPVPNNPYSFDCVVRKH